MIVEVTIGWTKPNRAIGYSNFDGYRPGASQHIETIQLDMPHATPTLELVEQIADAVFEATNSSQPTHGCSLPAAIAWAIGMTGYWGEGAHYSLSVGDTVTVGEVMLACARTGWTRVR